MKNVFEAECYKICDNPYELANIVLDICYNTKNSKQFAWDICGDIFIKNILNKNNNKICGTKDKTAKTPPRIPSQINPPTQAGEASSNDATQDVILSVRIPTRFCKITPIEFIPPSVHNNPSKAVPSKLELFNNPPK